MDRSDITVTSMKHCLIKELVPAPFDDLVAKGYDGTISFLSFDSFRRLYNDALESLQQALRIISELESERDQLSEYCASLEDSIHGSIEE